MQNITKCFLFRKKHKNRFLFKMFPLGSTIEKATFESLNYLQVFPLQGQSYLHISIFVLLLEIHCYPFLLQSFPSRPSPIVKPNNTEFILYLL